MVCKEIDKAISMMLYWNQQDGICRGGGQDDNFGRAA